MQKCYAVYRIESLPFEYDVRFDGMGRICFHGGVGEFACDLGDLTDSQLEELENRAGGEVGIRVSDNWNIDQYERSIILLVKDSNLDDAIRIDLGRMKKQYEQAMEDFGVVAKRLIPLKRCASTAKDIITESQLAAKEAGVPDVPTPTQTTTPSGPATNNERDKRLYELSFDMNLTWGDIAAMVNNEFPDELLNAKSAPVAAKRYAKKNKGLKPIPNRKAGRKPQG